MILIKVILTGLLGASICMADISGIVMDIDTTRIAGAVVQLETGGQTVTTAEDGSFTLVVASAILPPKGARVTNGWSARISGNMLNVTLPEMSAVEVTVFDLTGKALSTTRMSLGAGSHSVALPNRRAGIYLYKVKLGNREFVIKGNSVGRGLFEKVKSYQALPSHSMAKQTKTMDAINDVITVTKDGYLKYRAVMENSDASGLIITLIASAGTVTDTDGNVYPTVMLGEQEWTVENLRVTKYNNGTAIPQSITGIAWDSCYYTEKGAFCYYSNTSNLDTIKKFGALYNWYSVNAKKLAPEGWHVPTDSEWTTMENYLATQWHNYGGTTGISSDMIAKALSAQTDWCTYVTYGAIGADLTRNNITGFSALPGGYRSLDGSFNSIGTYGYWWSAQETDASRAFGRYLYYAYGNLYGRSSYKSCGFSVRLVKDN